jgi:hypothetical protein
MCIECAALLYFSAAFSCLCCSFPALLPPPLVVFLQVWYTHASRKSVHSTLVKLWYVVKVQKGSTMKAVATALVLIAGAAVVLWYGNTLNSWVLGGLIGGLAALLLSIPLSLTVFSYLSRRHDEQLRAEAQEEMALRQAYNSPRVRAEIPSQAYALDEDAYQFSLEEQQWREEEERRRLQTSRNLPVPSSPRSLVPQQAQVEDRLLDTQRGVYTAGTKQLPQKATPEKEATSRRAPTRRMYYPGFPGYQPRSQHQSAALRAARQEAAQRYGDDVEVLPTHISRRLPAVQPLPQQQRPSRQLPPQSTNSHRERRTADMNSARHDARRSLPAGGESSSSQPRRYREPQTDYLEDGNYLQTGPMQQSMQTDALPRNPQSQELDHTFDGTTGALHNPLVRRAPYMYEDDSLRQELAQYIGPPLVRRSSRVLRHEQDEQDQD